MKKALLIRDWPKQTRIFPVHIKKSTIVEAICFLFVLLFMYAAVSKLLDYEKFRAQLGQSPMLAAYSSWVAIVVPVSEILISVVLGLPKTKLLGLYLAYSLMVMFTAYIIVIKNFSEYVPCSCGGILQHMSWDQHLYFNILFVAMGMGAILLHDKNANKPS